MENSMDTHGNQGTQTQKQTGWLAVLNDLVSHVIVFLRAGLGHERPGFESCLRCVSLYKSLCFSLPLSPFSFSVLPISIVRSLGLRMSLAMCIYNALRGQYCYHPSITVRCKIGAKCYHMVSQWCSALVLHLRCRAASHYTSCQTVENQASGLLATTHSGNDTQCFLFFCVMKLVAQPCALKQFNIKVINYHC